MSWRLETLEQENKKLKLRVDRVERENRELKQSLYELSARHSLLVSHSRRAEATGGSGSATPCAAAAAAADIDAVLSGIRIDPDALDDGAETMWESAKIAGGAGGTSARLSHVGSCPQLHLGGSGVGAGGAAPLFQYQFDLRGHQGSVHAVRFAPDGQLIASGAFDSTVRLWDVQRTARDEQAAALRGHTSLVADVCWAEGSSALASGSYDHTVKVWSVQQAALERSWTVPAHALVQKVVFQQSGSGGVEDGGGGGGSGHVVLVATSHPQIVAFDRRADGIAFVLDNNGAMVNAISCYSDGVHLLSGDKRSHVKTWDLRNRGVVDSFANGELHKPVSHIEIAAAPAGSGGGVGGVGGGGEDGRSGGEDRRFVAVNSYDNVLRVYTRSKGTTRLDLQHALKGHYRNRAYPICSAFRVGRHHHRATRLGAPRRMGSTVHMAAGAGPDAFDDSGGSGGGGSGVRRPAPVAHGAGGGGGSCTGGGGVTGADAGEDLRSAAVGNGGDQPRRPAVSVHDSLLLATGSIDPHAYVFDVGGPGDAELVQRLEGHTDIVYGVSFHPHEPILVTCSADQSIKYWEAKVDRYRAA